jgi:hypothetical protein
MFISSSLLLGGSFVYRGILADLSARIGVEALTGPEKCVNGG